MSRTFVFNEVPLVAENKIQAEVVDHMISDQIAMADQSTQMSLLVIQRQSTIPMPQEHCAANDRLAAPRGLNRSPARPGAHLPFVQSRNLR